MPPGVSYRYGTSFGENYTSFLWENHKIIFIPVLRMCKPFNYNSSQIQLCEVVLAAREPKKVRLLHIMQEGMPKSSWFTKTELIHLGTHVLFNILYPL